MDDAHDTADPFGVRWTIRPRPGHRAEIDLDGWMPTFHAAPAIVEVDLPQHFAREQMAATLGRPLMQHEIEMPIGDAVRKATVRMIDRLGQTTEMLTGLTVQAMESALEAQRYISEAARLSGMTAPLPWPVRRPVDLAVGHILMARPFVSMLVEMYGAAEAALVIRERAFRLLGAQGNDAPDQGLHDASDGGMTVWCDENGPWAEFDETISRDGDKVSSISGNIVTLRGRTLPETLVMACSGRLLGDVVRTGLKSLDDTVIDEARVEGDAVEIRLDCEWDPLGEQESVADHLR